MINISSNEMSRKTEKQPFEKIVFAIEFRKTVKMSETTK